MRIIDPTPQPDVEKTISYRYCGAKLGYVPRDVKERTVRDYGGGTDLYRYIVCPIEACGRETEVRA